MYEWALAEGTSELERLDFDEVITVALKSPIFRLRREVCSSLIFKLLL